MRVNGEKIKDIKAVALSGGMSRRMGSDKLLLPLGGETLLEHTVRNLQRVFEHVAISVSDPGRYADIGLAVERIADIHRGRGPLGGLHAALQGIAAEDEIKGIFLVAADLPFAGPAEASAIIEQAEGCDVCVPTDEQGRYEPLFAYYAKGVLPRVEEALNAGVNKVVGLYPAVAVKVIPAAQLTAADSEKLFFNINYPEDYRAVKDML
jgi:molybdopterin-guanine dinucleotide biosynthesis protein A